MSSPAEIIRQLLIDLAVGTETGAWPIYISFLPSTPHEAIVIYDLDGKLDGRLMITGEQIEHPGIQIMIRGRDYAALYTKLMAVTQALDFQINVTVALNSEEAYIVNNISRMAPPMSLGVETEGDVRRHYFEVNAMLTLRGI